MKNLLVWGAGLLGVAAAALGAIYFITPAQSLPAWLPGFDVASAKIHYKHAIGSFIAALGLFALAWFQSGPAKKVEHKG